MADLAIIHLYLPILFIIHIYWPRAQVATQCSFVEPFLGSGGGYVQARSPALLPTTIPTWASWYHRMQIMW